MRNIAGTNCASRFNRPAHYRREYASPGDFCEIFIKDMGGLYSLALLLTGSHETAEQCFLTALDDCQTGSTVFPDWARSWSRRAIIENAIRLLRPTPANSAGAPATRLEAVSGGMDTAASPLFQSGLFDRFAFVISVLEGYSTRESAALLGCSPKELKLAQVRVLQKVAQTGLPVAPSVERQVPSTHGQGSIPAASENIELVQ